ncbi:Gfo/Idh/MocA family protein [Vagococcus entomophilus]|uniref:Oxidoreductase n=1 Tax=Vagococcus entomophilus TaxID=1160095 RepID=A0A430AHX2_9ENTE|nr:Gfo/Idh/MocA family oxidoreductase [Vagococcus entomophilus]RSU07709.1 oxidoreductase [Vagococcus entomophilus]
MKKYCWAMIGAGTIAKEMTQAIQKVNGEVYGVLSTTLEKAQNFCRENGVKNAFESVEEIMEDPKIDIIYIATPHNSHYFYIKKALEAGKHVLCEKVLTVNAKQAKEVSDLAKKKKLVVMEAMTIYHMPLFKLLQKKIEEGLIGQVKMLQINFGSHKEYNLENRFFNKSLAGGALLDIGVYALAFSRYFMSSQPVNLATMVNYFETGVDEQSIITMKNFQQEMAVITLTMQAKQPKRALISGTKGYVEVLNYPRAESASVTFTKNGKKEIIEVGETHRALEYEVKDMQELVEQGEYEHSLSYTLDVLHTMDNVRNEWGLIYPFEQA